jgi:hypothetical protein
MSSQSSSIRTSLQNFRQRVGNLVEAYEPYLEFIGERQLLSAIINTSPNASEEDLAKSLEENNNSASKELINQYIVNAIQNISSGGQLVHDFSNIMNILLGAASQDDTLELLNYNTVIVTQESTFEGEKGLAETLMGPEELEHLYARHTEYLNLLQGEIPENTEGRIDIGTALTNTQRQLIESRFFSHYPDPAGRPEHNIFNANIPQPALEVFTDEAYIDYLDPYNLRALQEIDRIRLEQSPVGQVLDSSLLSRDNRPPTRATVQSTTFQENYATRRTIARNVVALAGLELQPYKFNLSPIGFPEPNNPLRGPNIAALVINDINLMPASRDTGFAELFLNFVPSVEMSRAVPYLDIGFIMPDGSNTQQMEGFATRPAITTLASALGYVNDGSTVNLANALFDGADSRETGENNSHILSGMELFLAPQTLGYSSDFVEPDDLAKGSSAYTAKPLDRFKPIASFLGITFDVSTTHGVIPYKTAKMSFKVHDRGRLHEMAMFIKPELYSKNHLYIEYGWSHPDNDIETNPFGYLINTLRTIEKYAIVNSSFNMDANGEIKLEVELAMQGADRMAVTDISRGEGVESVAEKIDEIIETIQRALNRLSASTDEQQIQEIFGQSILGAISSTDSSVTLLNEELQEQINQTIRQLRDDTNPNPDINALRDGLISLYGDPDNPSDSANNVSLVRQLQATIAASVELKRVCLYNACDPWISRNLIIKRIRPNGEVGEQEINTNGSSRDSYVSLAKALMLYVGKPLMSTKKFAEVQFMFYPFNANSANLRNQSTASFPLKRSEFLKMLSNATKLTANLPLERFINLVNLNFVSNIANEAYGMSELYELADETGNVRLVESLQNDQTRVIGLKQQLLRAIYGGPEQEARFSQPSIKFILEAVPRNAYQLNGEQAITFAAVDLNKTDNQEDFFPNEDYLSQTILRIHVIDERCTPHESAGKILKAARSNQFNAIRQATDNEPDVVGHIANANLAIEMAINEGLLESLPNNIQNDSAASSLRTYRIKGGTGAVKKFLRKSVPTIRFGTNGSALLDATFSSANEPAMFTINMRRAARGGDKPPGIMDGGLPLEIHPTEASMTTIGFPFFGIAQQFFIDFDTGTTADNIYAINSVSHEIGPGVFKSNVKLLRTTEAFGEYRSFVDQIANALNTIPVGNSDSEE